MNMILTLKSVKNDSYLMEIEHPYGKMEYKEIEPTKLYDFVQAHDFYCEVNNYELIFLLDASLKSFVGTRLKEWIQLYTNKND
jgi:hypothetical protein